MTTLADPPVAARSVESPTGALTVTVSRRGVRSVRWGDQVPAGLTADHPLLDEVETQLAAYFAGTLRTFDLPLDPVGTPFQLAAWDVLRGIPYGETITYGEQARRLGDARKARAVGAANGRNPIALVLPCHRVIGHDGSLVGYGGGLHRKRWLLAHEGAGGASRLLPLAL
jgi:methylated-DNA-[protein]-cysteine S-methyltransferase